MQWPSYGRRDIKKAVLRNLVVNIARASPTIDGLQPTLTLLAMASNLVAMASNLIANLVSLKAWNGKRTESRFKILSM